MASVNSVTPWLYKTLAVNLRKWNTTLLTIDYSLYHLPLNNFHQLRFVVFSNENFGSDIF